MVGNWLKQITHRYLKYQDLLYFLVRSDIVRRYRQTKIGPLWAIVEPVISMVILSFVFGRIKEVNVESLDIPYPIFLYSGMLPWVFVRSSISRATNVLVANRAIVQRVYFPREILVVSPIISSLFDFAMSSLVLFAMMLYFKVPIQPQILLVIIVMIGVFGLSFGLSLFFSGLNARVRDIGQAMPYAIQIWMYISPVIYPPSFLGAGADIIVKLNPMTGYLNLIRGVIIGTSWEWQSLLISIAETVVVLILGVWYFKKTEVEFVDLM